MKSSSAAVLRNPSRCRKVPTAAQHGSQRSTLRRFRKCRIRVAGEIAKRRERIVRRVRDGDQSIATPNNGVGDQFGERGRLVCFRGRDGRAETPPFGEFENHRRRIEAPQQQVCRQARDASVAILERMDARDPPERSRQPQRDRRVAGTAGQSIDQRLHLARYEPCSRRDDGIARRRIAQPPGSAAPGSTCDDARMELPHLIEDEQRTTVARPARALLGDPAICIGIIAHEHVMGERTIAERQAPIEQRVNFAWIERAPGKRCRACDVGPPQTLMLARKRRLRGQNANRLDGLVQATQTSEVASEPISLSDFRQFLKRRQNPGFNASTLRFRQCTYG